MSKSTRQALIISGVLVILLLIAYWWHSPKSNLSSKSYFSKKASKINYNAKHFERGQQQAVATSEFIINIPMAGQVNMALQKIVTNSKMHQKYRIDTGNSLMLSAILENQKGGIVIDLEKNTQLQYDLTNKTFYKKELLKKNASKQSFLDSPKSERPSNQSEDPQKIINKTKERLNGVEVVKLYSKSIVEDGAVSETTRWITQEKLQVLDKVKTIEDKIGKLTDLEEAGALETITRMLAAVMSEMEELEEEGGSILKFELSVKRKENKKPLTTIEYNLLNYYFEAYNSSDFDIDVNGFKKVKPEKFFQNKDTPYSLE